METSIGICFKEFTLVATDQTSARSILVMKNDSDKTHQLADNIIMTSTGAPGDAQEYGQFIAKNCRLYKMQNGHDLSPHAAANFTRRNLADYLRSRTPFQVDLLIAGYNKEGCELYTLDYLASMVKVPYAVHGYGGFFASALSDRHYRSDMTKEEAYSLIKDCVKEIQERLIISLPNFDVTIVDGNGIKKLAAIKIVS
jgi:20S proteasome subunit beta 4